MNSLGEVVNNAMELVEKQSEQLAGVLPKTYTEFSDSVLSELLRIFNNNALNQLGGDVVGRIYEYFLSKFAKNIASDDGVFFTPKSLVKMIVNVLEPKSGILLDPACGSGGMFVQTGDFVNNAGLQANRSMTFYGQEKVEYNAQLCLMNLAVHGLSGVIKSGDEANTFYHDAHNLEGKCDYVMANPPFNVDKVKAESTKNAGRLPFGCPSENKKKEISNGNYLWISYFYSYLKDSGRAGFVMASSATDSGSDKDIRLNLIDSGAVDVMVSVGNNFFYTKSLPCTLWFFDKAKKDNIKDKVLFIDARNYYTVIDRTLNEWSEWQLKNLNAIVWLYRGETDKYKQLLEEYRLALNSNDTFENILLKLQEELASLQQESKQAVDAAPKKEKKKLQLEYDKKIADKNEIISIAKEAVWLYEKFGNGEYKDILGLCKIEDKQVIIEEKGASLTPGAYVGVATQEDDGVNFEERMKEIHQSLLKLQNESNELMETISNNIREMGL